MLVTPGTNRCEATLDTLDEHRDSQSTPLETNKTRSKTGSPTGVIRRSLPESGGTQGRDTKHIMGDAATGASREKVSDQGWSSQKYTAKEEKQDKAQTHLIIFYPNLCDFSFQRLCDSLPLFL